MRYKFIVRPEAEADIEGSFYWYEDQREGLGHDFKNSVSHSFNRIKANPISFPEIYRGLRKVLLDRFPYTVYFLVSNDNIIVFGCVHQKRDPRVWKARR